MASSLKSWRETILELLYEGEEVHMDALHEGCEDEADVEQMSLAVADLERENSIRVVNGELQLF